MSGRDLRVVGIGTALAVGALALPAPLGVRFFLSVFLLVLFVTLAVIRLGADRVPPEEFLRRWWVGRRPRRYVYARPAPPPPEPAPAPPVRPPREPAPAPPPALPVAVAWGPETGAAVAGAGLLVAAAYFLAYLAGGGWAEFAAVWARLLPR
jgi:hypothetical protein